MSKSEIDAVARVLVTPQRLPNPALVGKSAAVIAEKCGISVPAGTRVLIAPLDGVGRDFPLSIEKLCPVLSYYVVKDWQEGCERCKQILRYGGMGHTMSIHSQNEQVILEFGLKKPAFRIVVNSPTTHGSIGLTTGLDPAMTLGCGGYGGNITSDNISPRHLLNIKRLAYEVTPAAEPIRKAVRARSAAASPAGITAEALTRRIDSFLGSRGYRPEADWDPGSQYRCRRPLRPSAASASSAPSASSSSVPLDLSARTTCEPPWQAGRTLLISERAIVTPSARDLGEQHRVFSHGPVRGCRPLHKFALLLSQLDLPLTSQLDLLGWLSRSVGERLLSMTLAGAPALRVNLEAPSGGRLTMLGRHVGPPDDHRGAPGWFDVRSRSDNCSRSVSPSPSPSPAAAPFGARLSCRRLSPAPEPAAGRSRYMPPPPPEDPVVTLIALSEQHFQAGQRELELGHVEGARLEFDKAVNVLLESAYGGRTEPRIREHFDRLVDRISAYEVQGARRRRRVHREEVRAGVDR